ncbi:MAG: ABC transporter substrate-binding protein [Oscillospiraceae bacterium]
MKKIVTIVMAILLAVNVSGCGSKEKPQSSATVQSSTQDSTQDSDTQKSEKLKIGILQQLEHTSLDLAKEGFIKALADGGYVDGENITIDFQNAQADQSNLLTMSQRFVNNKSDLILAIATGAAQSAAAQTKDIPILFTAVTDPVAAGLVNSNEAPGGNISGTNDMSPMEKQIELMLTLAPDTKTVGVMYTSSEDNSVMQAAAVKEILKKKGLTYIEQTVTSSNDVQQATQSIVTKCDAIYIPTDNTFASAMPIVGEITQKAKVPVICGEESPVKNGGLATLGLNYYNLGHQTGEMAVRVLKGEDISKLPVESQEKYSYLINGETAKAIGITVPDELKEFVK